MQRHSIIRTLLLIAGIALAHPALAQWTQQSGPYQVTVEGYANFTTAVANGFEVGRAESGDDVRTDLALRALGRIHLESGPDVGVRVVAESSPEGRLNLAEASLLLLGRSGRLEIGDRQGLPDVLTGYAPNNFTFTGAEFGPASGPSLDPGGGLQHAFLSTPLARQLNELGSLGATTSLAGDRSTKLVYVSPKNHGFLAGLSYATNADDPRFGALTQAGLVHERYWDSNELRLGVSASYANGASLSDLRSVNVGATLILDYDLMLGISATWNGKSGLATRTASRSNAYGFTSSVNYNRGRWTTGGYLQWSTSEGDDSLRGSDRLTALELGVSYRLSTKVRLYAAWYHFAFTDEGGHGAFGRETGDQVLLGARAAL